MGRERWAEVGAGGCTQDVCRVAEWSRESSRVVEPRVCLRPAAASLAHSLTRLPACMRRHPCSLSPSLLLMRDVAPSFRSSVKRSLSRRHSCAAALTLAPSLSRSTSHSLAPSLLPHTLTTREERLGVLSLFSRHTPPSLLLLTKRGGCRTSDSDTSGPTFVQEPPA